MYPLPLESVACVCQNLQTMKAEIADARAVKEQQAAHKQRLAEALSIGEDSKAALEALQTKVSCVLLLNVGWPLR